MTSLAADDAAFSGKWQIYNDIAGTTFDQACTFRQTGSELSGRCEMQNGPVDISGKVDQKKVTWTYKTASSQGGMVTLVYTGELNLTTGITRITGTTVVQGVRGAGLVHGERSEGITFAGI